MNRITVNGYNLGTTSLAARISSGSTDLSTALSPVATWVSNSQITVTKAAAGMDKSGYLTITVNGVASPNNVNDNTEDRNDESSFDPRTEQWTDNRFLWVWATTRSN